MSELPTSPTATPTKRRAARAFQVQVFAGGLVVFSLIVGGAHRVASQRVRHFEEELRKQKDSEAELAGVSVPYGQYIYGVRNLEQRVDVIQTLQSTRVGPVPLMAALRQVVNSTRDVGLYKAELEGNHVRLRGQARSLDAEADLLTALARSGKWEFPDVRLVRFYEDNWQTRVTYRFELDCVHPPPQPPASTSGGAAPAGKPASGPGSEAKGKHQAP